MYCHIPPFYAKDNDNQVVVREDQTSPCTSSSTRQQQHNAFTMHHTLPYPTIFHHTSKTVLIKWWWRSDTSSTRRMHATTSSAITIHHTSPYIQWCSSGGEDQTSECTTRRAHATSSAITRQTNATIATWHIFTPVHCVAIWTGHISASFDCMVIPYISNCFHYIFIWIVSVVHHLAPVAIGYQVEVKSWFYSYTYSCVKLIMMMMMQIVRSDSESATLSGTTGMPIANVSSLAEQWTLSQTAD